MGKSKKARKSGQSGAGGRPFTELSGRLALLNDRYWKAIAVMDRLNLQLAAAQHGLPAAPSERMVASILFTRGANLLMSMRSLLKEGWSLEGAALLRPLFENAADACFIAYHESETATNLAERLIAYQPIPDFRHVRLQRTDFERQQRPGAIFAPVDVVDDPDPIELARAIAGIEAFERQYPTISGGDKNNWSGLGLGKKGKYLDSAIDMLPIAQRRLLTKEVRYYLDEFVHGGPTVWKGLLAQDERVIDYKLGPQDRPEVMKLIVPTAVILSAITNKAVVELWGQAGSLGAVASALGEAAGYLSPAPAKDTIRFDDDKDWIGCG